MTSILDYLAPPNPPDLLGPSAIIIAALIGLVGLLAPRALNYCRTKQCTKLRRELQNVCFHVEIDDRRVKSLCYARADSSLSICLECGKRFLKRQEERLVQQWSTLTPDEAGRRLDGHKMIVASVKRKLRKRNCGSTEVS